MLCLERRDLFRLNIQWSWDLSRNTQRWTSRSHLMTQVLTALSDNFLRGAKCSIPVHYKKLRLILSSRPSANVRRGHGRAMLSNVRHGSHEKCMFRKRRSNMWRTIAILGVVLLIWACVAAEGSSFVNQMLILVTRRITAKSSRLKTG